MNRNINSSYLIFRSKSCKMTIIDSTAKQKKNMKMGKKETEIAISNVSRCRFYLQLTSQSKSKLVAAQTQKRPKHFFLFHFIQHNSFLFHKLMTRCQDIQHQVDYHHVIP